jgi:hypothetical protein
MWPAAPSATRAHRRSKTLTPADLVRHVAPPAEDRRAVLLWHLSIGECIRYERLQQELLCGEQSATSSRTSDMSAAQRDGPERTPRAQPSRTGGSARSSASKSATNKRPAHDAAVRVSPAAKRTLNLNCDPASWQNPLAAADIPSGFASSAPQSTSAAEDDSDDDLNAVQPGSEESSSEVGRCCHSARVRLEFGGPPESALMCARARRGCGS